ncbi:MAG: hypothetical protein WBA66_02845 [Xanthobacteraceae bacterium]
MHTTTNGPQRPTGAISARPATRQRKNKTRISEPLQVNKAETGIPVTDFFKTWPRKDREALIEVLIDTLDADAGDPDDEPSLGFVENHPTPPFDSDHWWPFKTSDGRQDIDQGKGDDREDEHDGREPPEDDEPSIGYDEGELNEGDDEPDLGFLECFTGSGRSGNAGGCAADREEDGSYVTEATRQRYKPFDRHVSNNDGRHVDVARGYGAYSHIRNLSDRQRKKVAPQIDLDSTVRVGQ